MTWGITATVAVTAYGAIQQHAAGSAQAAYSKKQAAYNDKMNLRRAQQQGVAIDTNTVRAKTEATAAVEAIENQSKEAASQARVAGAALGVGSGSYDTVLNTFAKKANQAEDSIMQGLVAELVGNKLQRQDVADQATQGQSTGTQRAPSVFGSILSGAANYFTSTYGLKNAFGGGSSNTQMNQLDIKASGILGKYGS